MRLYTYLLFVFFSNTIIAQTDTISGPPSNSFLNDYLLARPSLHYSYDQNNQIHDYSDNWDFDNDGKNDDLYFVGTGGAHLYYYLRIILSNNRIIQNFEWILCDMPYLGEIDDLKKNNNLFPQFIVNDFNNDGISDIYIKLDTTSSIPEKLKKRALLLKNSC